MIYTILKKNYPVTVLKFKIKDLDMNKVSEKFFDLNLNSELEVYIKCDLNGNIEYRGKKQEYRIYSINSQLVSVF